MTSRVIYVVVLVFSVDSLVSFLDELISMYLQSNLISSLAQSAKVPESIWRRATRVFQASLPQTAVSKSVKPVF